MEKREMVLSGRTWTHCWWRIWREFSLYKPGLSAGRGEGIASLCTTWTLCYGGQGNASRSVHILTLCFSLDVLGLTAGGGYGESSLCTTWTVCYGGQGNASRSVRILTLCFSMYVAGLSAGE